MDLLTLLITLVETLLPTVLNQSGASDEVITLLESIVPLIAKEAAAVLPAIQGVIATLQSSGVLSESDWTRVKALDVQIDAAFDAATKDD